MVGACLTSLAHACLLEIDTHVRTDDKFDFVLHQSLVSFVLTRNAILCENHGELCAESAGTSARN